MTLPQSNLLAGEASLYLRQHADNPVNWRPWSAAALAEAGERDCPILLSVGYAACHWCHVMAHESFESPEIAAVMNRLFVNIKVDREERPDIDQIYMAALTAMGEQGGWPLTMVLTPAGEPIWGGTYFPPEPRYGRPGFAQILEAVARAWQQDRDKLLAGAAGLKAHIAHRLDRTSPGRAPQREDLRALASAVGTSMDREKGGLSGAPKFPNAPFLTTLWLDWLICGTGSSRDAVLLALRAMLRGGIYDHVGGGLARYSTDADWLVPHFEKMLYDNAQLIRLCNWAFAETSDVLFRVRIEEIIKWIASEMIVDGGFASSLDADSDGEEGLFYTWTQAELTAVLGEDAEAFLDQYELVTPAQWHGDPILRQKADAPADDARSQRSLTRLLAHRAQRTRPGRDDKVLTDWNGLAIAAIAGAAATFGREDWLALAVTAYRAIRGRADAEGRLPHALHARRDLFPALSSDYAAMANAAISLHAATGDPAYLGEAANFLALLERWHADAAGDGYYLTASDATDVPLRIRGDIDEAIASATAQIIEAQARLAIVTSDPERLDKTWRVADAAMGRAVQQAYGQAGIINACALLIEGQKLLIVDDRQDFRFVTVANRYPDPRRVVSIHYIGEATADLPLPGGMMPDRTAPAAYLCEGQSCRPPLRTPEALTAALSERIGSQPG
jgi:uncharacterized protein YyaL (SSP411 family)